MFLAGTLLASPFGPPFAFSHLGHHSSHHPTGAVGQTHSVLPMNGTTPAAVQTLAMSHQASPHSAAATGRIGGTTFGSFNPNPFNLIYWHYPSPPVSPTAYFAAHHSASPAMVNMRDLR